LSSKYLSKLSILSGLLPVILYLVFRNRNKDRGLQVIFLYTLISFIIDNFFGLLPKSKVTQFFLFSTFTIIEYVLFSVFVYLNYKSIRIKQSIIIGSVIFLAFVAYSLFSFKTTTYQFDQFDSLPASVEAILVILYCVLFFYEQLRSPEISFVYSSKKFWVIVAFLIYLSATLFLFISTAYLSEAERKEYWPILLIANIIKNLLIATAFTLSINKSRQALNHTISDEIRLL
jgi:hypothetical protein